MAAEIPNLVKRNGICWFLSQTVDEPNKLGPGFQNSTLYYMAKPYILQQIQSVTPTVAMRMFTVETHGIFLNICPNW